MTSFEALSMGFIRCEILKSFTLHFTIKNCSMLEGGGGYQLNRSLTEVIVNQVTAVFVKACDHFFMTIRSFKILYYTCTKFRVVCRNIRRSKMSFSKQTDVPGFSKKIVINLKTYQAGKFTCMFLIFLIKRT